MTDTPPATAKPKPRRRKYLRTFGPGLVTGAEEDDPSGIATYSQAGAQFGFALMWTVPLTLPFRIAIQLVSARIGRVTGPGITVDIRLHHPMPIGWMGQKRGAHNARPRIRHCGVQNYFLADLAALLPCASVDALCAVSECPWALVDDSCALLSSPFV